MRIVIILICIDIALGIYNGFLNKEITSIKSFIGMFKKSSIIGVCVGVKYAEIYLHEKVLETVIYFFIITEVISILEHLKRLGIPVPGILENLDNDKKGGDNIKNDKK